MPILRLAAPRDRSPRQRGAQLRRLTDPRHQAPFALAPLPDSNPQSCGGRTPASGPSCSAPSCSRSPAIPAAWAARRRWGAGEVSGPCQRPTRTAVRIAPCPGCSLRPAPRRASPPTDSPRAGPRVALRFNPPPQVAIPSADSRRPARPRVHSTTARPPRAPHPPNSRTARWRPVPPSSPKLARRACAQTAGRKTQKHRLALQMV